MRRSNGQPPNALRIPNAPSQVVAEGRLLLRVAEAQRAHRTEHPYTPLMQSRRGVRPVSTEALVGEQTVPEECESCISTEPFRSAHSAILGVFAVPPFHLKSAHLCDKNHTRHVCNR